MLKYRIVHLSVSSRAKNAKTFKEKLYKNLHICIKEQLKNIKKQLQHIKEQLQYI
jgi:hypothetical protein